MADKACAHALKQVKKLVKKKLDEGDNDDDYDDDIDDMVEKKSKNYVGMLYNGLLATALTAYAAAKNEGMDDEAITAEIKQDMTDYAGNANNLAGGEAIADVWADGKQAVFLDYENEPGVSGYVWIVHWMSTTCAECADLDGETYDKYIDIPDRPVHPNCNCDVEPISEN